MKRATILLLVGVAGIGLAMAITASVLHDGLSARAKPSGLETLLARQARHLAIPASAQKEQNPVLDSAEIQHEARLHFADHCAVCHANDGSGRTLYGEGLYPKPPDLRMPPTQDLTDGELFWIIENGVRFTGMPAFSRDGNPESSGDHRGAQDSWKLAHFIRHLPHLTAAEQIEMERNNPKGPEDRAEEQSESDFLNSAAPKTKPQSSDKRER